MTDAISRSGLRRTLETRNMTELYPEWRMLSLGTREKIGRLAETFRKAIDCAPGLDVAPKWISVKDRLPEENKDVLVWANGCASISQVYDKDMIDGSPVWSYTGLGSDPLYWMPLPEPPEEENNETD